MPCPCVRRNSVEVIEDILASRPSLDDSFEASVKPLLGGNFHSQPVKVPNFVSGVEGRHNIFR